MRMHVLVSCLALGVLAGCSGATTTSVSVDTASADVAAAYCQRFDGCSDLLIRVAYGNVTQCAARLKLSLANALAAPGTGRNAANLESCAKALPAAACDDLLDHDLPAPCQPVAGTLATGKACSDSSQCSTAFCNIAAGQTCGACAAPPSVGSPCGGNDGCPAGEVCQGNTGGSGSCVVPAAAGAACSATQPCRATLVCRAGVCSSPDSVGGACGTDASTCDTLTGDYCQARSLTCVQVGLADPGSACGALDGGFTLCTTSGACTSALGGTCKASATDGENCDTASGPSCMPPAVCQNGVCTLPDSTACK